MLRDRHRELLARRRFLARATGVSVAALLLPLAGYGSAAAGRDETSIELTTGQRATLSAVQIHLFPDEKDAPGAVRIKALDYLRGVLADDALDLEDRRFIVNGIGWLDEISRAMHQAEFVTLDETRREQVLRHIEKSGAGENWLATLVLYLLEALLSDPVYGGNPDGVGWRWLQHQPGFPRPPADKTHTRLGGR